MPIDKSKGNYLLLNIYFEKAGEYTFKVVDGIYKSSSNTTWIIIGITVGVLTVVGAVIFIIKKKQQ